MSDHNQLLRATPRYALATLLRTTLAHATWIRDTNVNNVDDRNQKVILMP